MALPPPPEVRATFSDLMAVDPEKAVAYLYDLELSCGYIKAEAIARNICWTTLSPYGEMECTINLSKPEKDPRDIASAAARSSDTLQQHAASPVAVDRHARADQQAQAAIDDRHAQHVPQCDLCWENEEFPGTPEHPAKPGLRIAAITLGNELWGLQYSPYAYFAEHCIALSREHRPMKIDEACFERLLDFADAFPFYFIGSNADLPIVGGSILSHDHFQGGRHVFPLMKAPIAHSVNLIGFPEVGCGIVDWPASVLRLSSNDRVALARIASRILHTWRTFSCEPCNIVATSEVPHNTLNPIVRKTGSVYLLDLVLRNNRTDAQHPWGIFHAPESMHHIKKENIGLIEIMGMAILPPRLADELPLVQHELLEAARQNLPPEEVTARIESQPMIAPHATWAMEVYIRRLAELKDVAAQRSQSSVSLPTDQKNSLLPLIQQEVACVFISILETTGVFKRNEVGAAGWESFISRITDRME